MIIMSTDNIDEDQMDQTMVGRLPKRVVSEVRERSTMIVLIVTGQERVLKGDKITCLAPSH